MSTAAAAVSRALIEHDFGLAQQQQYLESLQEMASLTQQGAMFESG